MATESARPRKRRKESAAAAEGWQPEVQWGLTFSLPGLAVQNLTMQVPLAHEQPDGEQISVFARMVSQPSRTNKPLLLFLQGSVPPTPSPTCRSAMYDDTCAQTAWTIQQHLWPTRVLTMT